MEKDLKCRLLFTLKEMALRKVAVLLWSSSDILSFYSNPELYGYGSKNIWIETVEKKIKDKIPTLELPESLIEQMIDIIRPIGFQIKRQMEFVKSEYFGDEYKAITLPKSAKLYWTVAGVIDYKKMAEKLVRSDELSIFKRYEIACVYCFEDYIPLLLERLPEVAKYYLYNKKLDRSGSSLTTYLKFSWPHILKGTLSKLNYVWRMHSHLTSFNQWAFECSVEKRYKAAAEYFFHKLTLNEREVSLKKTVKLLLGDILSSRSSFLSRFRDEILCFLLSVMTPQQRMETVEANHILVLLCFLDLPLKDLFLENAELIWTILPPNYYVYLLFFMADRLEGDDYYFPKLFQEFFIRSPQDLKTCFAYKNYDFFSSPAARFLSIFFKLDDSESIKVIFRNIDAADRAKLVFEHKVVGLFSDFILNENWRLVALCLQEAGLSKEEKERLYKVFTHNLEIEDFEFERTIFKRFFEFFDETNISSNKKRKVLEE